jgi:uncharacterized protein
VPDPVQDNKPLVAGSRFGFRDPRVDRTTVQLPGFKGRKRVVHLTDLHFGNMTPLALQEEAVALANQEAGDVVVLTGDFVARGLSHLERLTATLGKIEGHKIAVLGNHDHWLDAARVQRALEAADVEVISNGWTTHDRGEDALALVCLDDFGTDHHDVDGATRHLLGRPALSLSHNPESAPLLWGKGVGLILSGHTHGGQLHVPRWTRRFYQGVLGARYVDGWYQEGDQQLFVNPGVGSSVVPFRYGRPACRTVAVLDVRGGEASAAPDPDQTVTGLAAPPSPD